MLIDLVNEVVGGASFFPEALTAPAAGTALDLSNGEVSTQAILDVGTVSGTTPTLNVQIEESDDQATWTAIPNMTFAQVTAASTRQVVRGLRTKRYARANATAVGGTTPSFTLAVEILAQKKYVGVGGGYDRSPSS